MKLPPLFFPEKMVVLPNAWQQRAITGAVALASQPVIEACNPFIDKKTKKFSIVKTISKCLVGASVGVAVRYGSQKAVKYLVKNKIIDPLKHLESFNKEQFINNFTMVASTTACFFTNFLLDMPLTKKLMNSLTKKLHLSKSEDKK